MDLGFFSEEREEEEEETLNTVQLREEATSYIGVVAVGNKRRPEVWRC